MKFYRFRPIQALLDWGELEQEYIYFSHKDDLNDPMEGHINLTFHGDRIIWDNFFKVYIFSVYSFWMRLILSGNSLKKEMQTEDIYVWFDPELKKSLSKKEIKDVKKAKDKCNDKESLYAGICNEFLNDDVIKSLLETLACREGEFTKTELMPLMFYAHIVVLSKLNKTAKDLSISFVNQVCGVILTNFYSEAWAEEQIKNICKKYKKYKNKHASKKYFEFFISEINEIEEKIKNYISDRYAYRLYKNMALLLNFPKIFMDKLTQFITPEHYVASFTTCCKNPLIWTHYGDSGKGVCLIYNFKYDEGKEHNAQSTKNELIGLSFRDRFAIREVKYIHDIEDIISFEFFSSFIPTQTVSFEHWFCQDETVSKMIHNHWGYGHNTDEKKAEYLSKVYEAINRKYHEFEYEKEYRIVFTTFFSETNNLAPNQRVKYKFEKLSGIIFGLDVSEKNKYEIIRIIKEKCNNYKREDFDFYQVRINDEGKIEIDKMDIMLNMINSNVTN